MSKPPARYLIMCRGCAMHIIGSKEHCALCPNCYRPNPLWRQLGAKEYYLLHVDLTLA